ncbi:MAG: hypothetical protein RLZZ292_2061 [Bacteroidota bacterium]|jgi:hypothetical protein
MIKQKNATFLIFPILFALACNQSNNNRIPQQTTTETTTDSLTIVNNPKSNLTIQMKSFSEIDSSGILLFPLSIGETGRKESSDYSYGSVPTSDFWNIVFYNSKTNDYHLLSEKKILIVQYVNKYGENVPKTKTTLQQIFYTIITDDTDKDNKLTRFDPSYLFVSNKEGNNLRQLSPKGYTLDRWDYIAASNKIVMIVRKDSDNNAKYDNNDEVSTFEIDMDKETTPREVFSTAFKNKLKLLFDKDWKSAK